MGTNCMACRHRKLFISSLPVRSCDALYSGLVAAFAPFGLMGITLLQVDLKHTYQVGAQAVVTVDSMSNQEAALTATISIAGQQVCFAGLRQACTTKRRSWSYNTNGQSVELACTTIGISIVTIKVHMSPVIMMSALDRDAKLSPRCQALQSHGTRCNKICVRARLRL